jgi:hypothetical protein
MAEEVRRAQERPPRRGETAVGEEPELDDTPLVPRDRGVETQEA